MKFFNMAFLVLFITGLPMAGYGSEQKSTVATPDVKAVVTAQHADTEDATGKETTRTGKPEIIDFGSKQCKACKAMEPILELLMKNHADKFITRFIDVWEPENKELALSHKISSIPTQIFFDAEGKEIFRQTGFISEEQILAKWQELGVLFPAKQVDKTIEPTTDGYSETGP